MPHPSTSTQYKYQSLGCEHKSGHHPDRPGRLFRAQALIPGESQLTSRPTPCASNPEHAAFRAEALVGRRFDQTLWAAPEGSQNPTGMLFQSGSPKLHCTIPQAHCRSCSCSSKKNRGAPQVNATLTQTPFRAHRGGTFCLAVTGANALRPIFWVSGTCPS